MHNCDCVICWFVGLSAAKSDYSNQSNKTGMQN